MKLTLSIAFVGLLTPALLAAEDRGEWTRVRRLAPGTKIVMTIRGLQPSERFVVEAGESHLSVLSAGGRGVESFGRDDVAEIMIRKKGGGVWGRLGAVGGYFVGGMAGGYISGFACQAAIGRQRCDTGAFLRGGLVGGLVGGGYGFRAAKREVEEVIYRAP